MSLTADEIVICNQSLFRIGAKSFAYATQTTINVNEAEKCETFYAQTRDALQRSFDWPFASERVALDIVKTLTLDASPYPSAWEVDDVITGLSSYTTATVVSVTSDVEYEIAYISGDFTDGETITDGDVEAVTWEGIPLTYEDETVLWYDTGNDVKCGTGYPVVENSTPDFEWDYKFKLPSDFLRVKSDYTADDTVTVNERFAIEGKYLLTDDDEAEIKYIKKITDPAEFDPLFTELFILTLAKKLIPALAGTKNPELVQDVNRDLATVTARARTVCGAETNTTGRSDWNLARFGSGKV